MERRCPTLEALRIVRIRSESEILEPSMEVEGDERRDWALALTTSAPIDMAWPEARTLSLTSDFSGMKLSRSQLGKIRIVSAHEPPSRH
ncbi:hypothetical protein GCM10008174_03390 [Methylopila turkensis]|uniref:Uncharacterized protein n=1 Tax=Methylopila turkensis TaxID=1437816 RepID=A0A9W6N5P9_9HYPH|nr:hypothetical protein GCM10008174_03390 [Methylopila turkensis]